MNNDKFLNKIFWFSCLFLLMSMIQSCGGLDSVQVLAKLNVAWAQEKLGERFHYGKGEERNLGAALKWYRLAADQGRGSAQDYMGHFYSGGLGGLEQSCQKSIYWFERAAANGYVDAWVNLSWKLATCENPKLRDGIRALEIMTHYLKSEEYFSPPVLDTMAAVYAENGNFVKAQRLQSAAIELLDLIEDKKRIEKYRKRLELYSSEQTWHGPFFENPSLYRETNNMK